MKTTLKIIKKALSIIICMFFILNLNAINRRLISPQYPAKKLKAGATKPQPILYSPSHAQAQAEAIKRSLQKQEEIKGLLKKQKTEEAKRFLQLQKAEDIKTHAQQLKEYFGLDGMAKLAFIIYRGICLKPKVNPQDEHAQKKAAAIMEEFKKTEFKKIKNHDETFSEIKDGIAQALHDLLKSVMDEIKEELLQNEDTIEDESILFVIELKKIIKENFQKNQKFYANLETLIKIDSSDALFNDVVKELKETFKNPSNVDPSAFDITNIDIVKNWVIYAFTNDKKKTYFPPFYKSLLEDVFDLFDQELEIEKGFWAKHKIKVIVGVTTVLSAGMLATYAMLGPDGIKKISESFKSGGLNNATNTLGRELKSAASKLGVSGRAVASQISQGVRQKASFIAGKVADLAKTWWK